MDLVTLIIPAFNAEKFIGECLESIKSQTYGSWEAIVVDDGSTDATAEIAARMAKSDPRIRLWRRRNGGPSAARNSGIAAAKGRWLAFVDADDMIHPQFIEKLLDAASQSGAEMAVCDFASGIEPGWNPALPAGKVSVCTGAKAFEASLYQTRRGINCSSCGKLFAARLFVGVRYVEGIRYEDLEIFGRLCLGASAVAHLRQPLYFYRTNGESFVHRFTPSRLDVLKVTEDIERRCSGNPALAVAARDRRFAANFNMLALAALAGHPAAESCWRQVKAYRREVLANPKTRLKNKLGALLSLLGRSATESILKIAYK